MRVALPAAKLWQTLLRPNRLNQQNAVLFRKSFPANGPRRLISYEMKELLIKAGPKVTVINSPIPTPNKDQVVIKVVAVGSNPKDWKRPEWRGNVINQGDDVAGYVHAVGENVTEFKPGDRVAAFHEMGGPGGGLAAMTAAMALFSRLPLPMPWSPAKKPTPLIIYGASSAVGCFAIQLAKRANIHPLLCVAGKGASHVETLIDRSKGDTIIDYRQGPNAVAQGFRDALRANGLQEVKYGFDVISGNESWKPMVKVMDPHGAITLLLPYPESDIPQTMSHVRTAVGGSHGGPGTRDYDPDLAYVFFRLFAKGLADGWFKGHPYEIRKGGLDGVEGALADLKAGKASAVKYVFRVEDTPGLGRKDGTE
ncbi:Trans-enoyl reductase [Lachnellula hyalina]|uniref:Trans-enoyl reductase n=1 Tax=Lachnellula hyalina TaxID=1316788 RepID=A0A8H8R2N1_9HELO|nr:Trans-enoyl reductase [Lachnellula hyalina]TVY27299.1 Trans-enoyl reductase [Lachnellula hyalina]